MQITSLKYISKMGYLIKRHHIQIGRQRGLEHKIFLLQEDMDDGYYKFINS